MLGCPYPDPRVLLSLGYQAHPLQLYSFGQTRRDRCAQWKREDLGYREPALFRSDRIQIRGYYFPWGTKRIPYSSIRSVRRVEIGALSGKGRIWGTVNPRYWASLDPQRPKKSVGLILDVGRYVRPFITPDDPDVVEALIREHSSLGTSIENTGSGPFI